MNRFDGEESDRRRGGDSSGVGIGLVGCSEKRRGR